VKEHVKVSEHSSLLTSSLRIIILGSSNMEARVFTA